MSYAAKWEAGANGIGRDYRDTCESRGWACCDEFPPKRPVTELNDTEFEDWYVEHHRRYDAKHAKQQG